MMVAGPLSTVPASVYCHMQAEHIWGQGAELLAGEVQMAQRHMAEWFGKKVRWGTMEASIFLQVFYSSTVLFFHRFILPRLA